MSGLGHHHHHHSSTEGRRMKLEGRTTPKQRVALANLIRYAVDPVELTLTIRSPATYNYGDDNTLVVLLNGVTYEITNDGYITDPAARAARAAKQHRDTVLQALSDAWAANPDWCLWALVTGAYSHVRSAETLNRVFFIDDASLMRGFNALVEQDS